ncbi:uncharacterized protein [Anabrus simplex]|uniref:uncharacterized protein n=1 Tax=Anabrus simplex TaxID=316456 RepID=UPI0035A26DAF
MTEWCGRRLGLYTMSSLVRVSCLLVVLLVFWNGANCQDEEETSLDRSGNFASTLMNVLHEASKIPWNPLQMCWMKISDEVRQQCDGGISNVRDLSCVSPDVAADAGRCLQKELMSNGDNLRELVMNMMNRRQ